MDANAVIGYEVFRDFLIIFLAVVTAVGAVLYKILSDAIEGKVTSATEIQLDKSLLGYFISSGYDYWRDYDEHMDKLFSMAGVIEEDLNRGIFPDGLRNTFKTKDIPLFGNISNVTVTKEKEGKWEITDKEKKNIFIIEKENEMLTIYKKDIWKLDQAINITKRGYEEYATKLEKRKKQDSNREWLICEIKNNLAYYYAEKQKLWTVTPSDKALAQGFVKYIYEKIDKYPKNKESWVDTHNFVQKQFSLNKVSSS